MSIRLSCPKCGKAGVAPDHAVGMQATCKQCGTGFRVEAAPEDAFSFSESMPIAAGAPSVFPSQKKNEREPFNPPTWSFSQTWEARCPKCKDRGVFNAGNYPCPICGGWVVVKLTGKGDVTGKSAFNVKLKCARNEDWESEAVACLRCGCPIQGRDLFATVFVYRKVFRVLQTIAYWLALPTMMATALLWHAFRFVIEIALIPFGEKFQERFWCEDRVKLVSFYDANDMDQKN